MFENLFFVWCVGTVSMTLDFIRIYQKSLRQFSEIKDIVVKKVQETLPSDQRDESLKSLDSDFSANISYGRQFSVGAMTMFLFWPIALFNLLFAENVYEKKMFEFFAKPFRIVFAKVFIELQAYLANDLTHHLVQELFTTPKTPSSGKDA
jgi:hypothetical protein